MFKIRWKGCKNQHVEEDDPYPWRILLHKRDGEEHVEDAIFCHNGFSYDFCNAYVYVDQ